MCRPTDIWKKANSKRSNFNQLRWMFFWFHFAFFEFQLKFSIKIISVGRRLHFRLKLKIKIGQELDSDMPFKQTLWSFYFIFFCLKMILECYVLHIQFNFIRKKWFEWANDSKQFKPVFQSYSLILKCNRNGYLFIVHSFDALHIHFVLAHTVWWLLFFSFNVHQYRRSYWSLCSIHFNGSFSAIVEWNIWIDSEEK